MYTISDNTPSAGCIQWSGLHMQYQGTTYAIADGYTNYMYVYWLHTSPTQLVVSNTFPSLTDSDCLVFLNKNGIHLTVPTATVLDGDLLVPGSVLTNALAANCITTTQLSANCVTSSQLAANSVTANELSANSVTANAIAANAIGASAIAAGVITGSKLVANTITAAQIASATITGTQIASNTITAANITANTITAAQIAANTITSSQIAANTITASQIQTGSITGDRISGGTITGCQIQTNSANNHAVLQDNIMGIYRDFSGGSVGAGYGTYMTASTFSSLLDFNACDPTGQYLTTLEIGNNNASTYITASSHTSGLTVSAPTIDLTATGSAAGNGVIIQNTATASGIEIGKTSSTDTPYIDFHSSANNIDYDARIIASGGSSTIGQGTLTFIASLVSIQNIKNATFVGNQPTYGSSYLITGGGNVGDIKLSGSPHTYLQVTSTDGSGAWGINIWASDMKLKKNINDSIEDALSKVMQIKHRQFDWKQDGTFVKHGYVAQELQSIDPDFVFGVPQEDGSEILNPRTDVLIPYLSKAIQQLQSKIEVLENKVEKLEHNETL
jgi:hypothetical protein